jgi:uncharacterized protein with FMN-binding domain
MLPSDTSFEPLYVNWDNSVRRLIAGVWIACCASLAATPPLPAKHAASQAPLSVDEAVRLALPKCEIKSAIVYLDDEQIRRARLLAGEPVEQKIVQAFAGYRDGKLAGTAYLDTHRVRTLQETILVVVDTQGRVSRIELIAFAEPREYSPRGAWYGQFLGRELDSELKLKKGIQGITGATLTSNATTAAVRRVLALHKTIGTTPVAPESRPSARE